MAARNGLNGDTLRKQYKEVISDFRTWDQKSHASSYILYPDNVGEHLSLDETCLSNGDVYTVLTDKSAHGRKGCLVAMVRGVASDDVTRVFRLIPEKVRMRVKTITTDLSSSMMLTARRSFPKARLVNDRFHVQKLMSEAIDQLRIRHRWEVLDAENRAIREHRQARKAAKDKTEKELIGLWEPKKMENGETMPQIMARSRYPLFKSVEKWTESQKRRASVLFREFPELKEAYSLSHSLRMIFYRNTKKDAARLSMARWYDKVEQAGFHSFNVIAATFYEHYDDILNFYNKRSSNAAAESFNAKIKNFRASLRWTSL